MLIYLAGAIYGQTYETAHDWRETVKKVFAESPHSIIDPTELLPDDADPNEIVTIDKVFIRKSQLMLARIDVFSWGTAMEIFYADSIGRNIIGWGRAEKECSYWLRHHCCRIYETLHDAIVCVRVDHA